MSSSKVCPVCKVKIEGDVVMFSYGCPGSLEKLYARVCQYVNRSGCINDFEGEYNPSEGYGALQNLHFNGENDKY